MGCSKFFMYLDHGKFHEYSNFMKVMLEVYCEPSLQKLAKLKQVLGKDRFLNNMVLCTKFVEGADNFVHTFRSIGILFTYTVYHCSSSVDKFIHTLFKLSTLSGEEFTVHIKHCLRI